MKAFLDTSVLIAAFWADHYGHDSSNALFAHAKREGCACGLHSLAEIYATMTAMPTRPILAPQQVSLLVEQVPERLTMISLTEAEYRRSIRDAAEKGMASGRIYDALLLACARKAQA